MNSEPTWKKISILERCVWVMFIGMGWYVLRPYQTGIPCFPLLVDLWAVVHGLAGLFYGIRGIVLTLPIIIGAEYGLLRMYQDALIHLPNVAADPNAGYVQKFYELHCLSLLAVFLIGWLVIRRFGMLKGDKAILSLFIFLGIVVFAYYSYSYSVEFG